MTTVLLQETQLMAVEQFMIVSKCVVDALCERDDRPWFVNNYSQVIHS